MSAANTDKFLKVGIAGTATTMGAPGHTTGGNSINVESTTNWPATTGVPFAIDQAQLVTVNGQQQEQQIPGTYTEWVGVVTSATTIGSMALSEYSPNGDQDYPSGSLTRVYIPVTATQADRLVDGILTHADQDGTLKTGAVDTAAVLADNVVTTAKILDANITTAKILDANVTAPKLSTDAITLGYAEITSDFTGASSTAEQDVTGLSVTVTVPSGGRRCDILLSPTYVASTGATGTFVQLKIKEGSTILAVSAMTSPGSSYALPLKPIYSGILTAGSHTYKATVQNAAGIPTVSAGATNPAFIWVRVF